MWKWIVGCRLLIFNHRQALAEQLRNETDAAMTLHLGATLLFQIYTNAMVHAPGRCVPQIIAYLEEYVNADNYTVLTTCQGKCCELHCSEMCCKWSNKR